MTSTNRAGRWIRVSGDTQSEADQLPEIDASCADRGYVTSEATLFTVHGKSAYKGAQDPDWLKVIAAFERHEIDVIVIWMVDRLDRKNILHAIPMVQKVLDAGGRIEFSEQPECNLDASDPDISDKVAAFADRIAAAHRESQIKSKRITKTFKRIDANGAIRNRAGYGHRIAGEKYGKRFELDDAEADVIRQAVSRYLGGQSLAHVCAWLTTSGHRGRNGAAFTPKTLGKILRSETLIGRFHQGDVVVRVPRILSVKDHKAVLAKLDAKAYRKGVRTRPDTALLTSILYCGICGRPMYAIKGGGTSQKKVWNADKTAKVIRNYPAPVTFNYYCRSGNGCRMLVPLEEADAEIDTLFLDSTIKIPQTRTIPGRNYDDDMDQVALDIQRLDPLAKGYREALDEKLAEIDRLRALPAIPDRTETRMVDLSKFATVDWPDMPPTAKRAFMIELGLKLYAAKDGDGNVTLTTKRNSE